MSTSHPLAIVDMQRVATGGHAWAIAEVEAIVRNAVRPGWRPGGYCHRHPTPVCTRSHGVVSGSGQVAPGDVTGLSDDGGAELLPLADDHGGRQPE